jgi:hypothetical protein
MENSKRSYDALKAHLEGLESDFRQKKAELERDLADYNAQVSSLGCKAKPKHRGIPWIPCVKTS